MGAPSIQAPHAEPVEADELDEPVAVEVERREGRVESGAHGERLDRWLSSLAGEFSRNHLQTLIEGGQVRVDGQAITSCSRRVSAGQRIEMTLLPTPESQAFRAEPVALPVVFEDEHLLVIDKPAGLVVHPAPGNWSGTVLNGLLAYHAGAAALPRAGIVHRLDKDTSGLMVVAKTLSAMTALTRAIAAREVHREYLALVHGVLRRAAFSIDAPIGRDPVSRIKMAVVPGGRAARTDVALLAARDAVSAVRCTLHTGRTHQIRVHMASCGHALLADSLYGGRELLGLTRQALHAHRLGFAHPVSRQALDFNAILPADLLAAWQQIVGAQPGAGSDTMRSQG
ncbi:RluA family pseudouridine synthase [Methylibium sp.]|uniref:RluA family pseudouridine synthase n=1 Tax=Methylibium sp. TaxID=2067992 RepID=UPI003D0A2722